MWCKCAEVNLLHSVLQVVRRVKRQSYVEVFHAKLQNLWCGEGLIRAAGSWCYRCVKLDVLIIG